jgi:hypothetical protein
MTKLFVASVLAAMAAQGSMLGRWIQRSEILDDRNIPSWCWDYASSEGNRATALVMIPVLGETLMWGTSYDKSSRPDFVTRITFLGQDDQGVTLEVLTVPATKQPVPRSPSNPLDACLAEALLTVSMSAATAAVPRIVRTPSPPANIRVMIGLEQVRLQLTPSEAGLAVIPGGQ